MALAGAAIDLDLYTNGVDNHDPNSGQAPQVAPGEAVHWTYEVVNTGHVTLTNITVTDDQGVGVSCPKTKLNAGEKMTCTATGAAANLQTDTSVTKVIGSCGDRTNQPLYQNIATVTGDAGGWLVHDTSRSFYCNPPRSSPTPPQEPPEPPFVPPPRPEPEPEPPPQPEPEPPPQPEPEPPPAVPTPPQLTTPDGQSGLAPLPSNIGQIPNLSSGGPGGDSTQPENKRIDESLQSMVRDGLGDLYITGYAYDGNTYNIVALKFSSEGDLFWQQQFDSGSQDYAYGITVDPLGGVYVAGYSLVGNTYRGELIKYDASGVFQWQREFTSGGLVDTFYGVAADASGVYVAGESYNGITFDGQVIKYDLNGNLIWRSLRATGRDDTAYTVGLTNCVQEDRNGQTMPVNCQPVIGGGDGTDVRSGWLRLLDPNNGVTLRDSTVASNTPIATLIPRPDGGIYAGGTTAAGDWEIINVDSGFNSLWNASFSGGGEDLLRGLTLDTEGFLYGVGRTFNGANNDVLILAYDPSGALVSRLQLDGGMDERGYSMIFDLDQRIAVAGVQRSPEGDTRFLVFHIRRNPE